MERSKRLRKSVYEIDEKMKEKFPAKTTTDVLVDEIKYCKNLIGVIENEGAISEYPKVKENLNLLKETLEDDIEHLKIMEDQDAKIGHKTADYHFSATKHISP